MNGNVFVALQGYPNIFFAYSRIRREGEARPASALGYAGGGFGKRTPPPRGPVPARDPAGTPRGAARFISAGIWFLGLICGFRCNGHVLD